MNSLVLGGTRYFGVHLVEELLAAGHKVTIATRGNVADTFGNKVSRIKLERTDAADLKEKLSGKHFDVVYDNINYCSNDTKALLDVLDTDRYIVTSSGSVYCDKDSFSETDFDPHTYPLHWGDRSAFTYPEGKRQMEAAVFQGYAIPSVAVRFPIVLGRDDYTKRLYFYVDRLMRNEPVKLEGTHFPFSFIDSKEAGRFLAYLANTKQTGTINASNTGTVTTAQIIDYIEGKAEKKMIVSDDGEPASFNTDESYVMEVKKAAAWGYQFPSLDSFLYQLLDAYLSEGKTV